jgi:hypothetical protein
MFNLHGIESKPGGVVVTIMTVSGQEYRVKAAFQDKTKRTEWVAGEDGRVLVIKVPYGNTAMVPTSLTLEVHAAGAGQAKVDHTFALDPIPSKDYLELGILPEYIPKLQAVMTNAEIKKMRDAIKEEADTIQARNAEIALKNYQQQLLQLGSAIINEPTV